MMIQANGNLIAGWESASFRNYDIYSSSDLISNDWTIVASNLPATAPLNKILLDTAAGFAFYRIEGRYPQ